MKIGITGPILTNSLKKYLDIKSNDYPIGLGGTAVNNIIIGFLEKGYKVSVYTLDRGIKSPIILNGDKLKIYFGNYRNHGYARISDFFRKESNQIKNFILEDRPDIVNAHWGYEFAAGAIKSKYPHFIVLRDSPKDILKLKKDYYRLGRLMLNLWVMKEGSNFGVNSSYLKSMLAGFKKDFIIIPNPVLMQNLSLEPKCKAGEKKKLVSILNGWSERKNPIPLLKAFKMLRNELGEKIELTFYGPDFGKNEAGEKWAIHNNYHTGVNFEGNVDHSFLMKNLKSYDIMVHPAKEESFGNTLVEAMGNGIPIVAGKNSGAVPEVLNYGRNGILVDVLSPGEIYTGVKKLLADTELYKSLSSEGIKYVEENFHSDEICEQYLKTFKAILEKSN